MSAVSNGRVLRIALAASVAVHLAVAAVLYAPPVTAAPEQQPQRTQIIKLQPPPATPTPPPPKPALPQPRQRASIAQPQIHRPRIARVDTHDPHALPPPAIEPTGDPNPYPVETSGPPETSPTFAPAEPTATPKPACSAPDVAAKTIVTQPADMPDDAAGYAGRARVKVDLDASGNVLNASIYESTGSMELDRAAVAAAQASRYAPEQRDCKNVSGSYLFVVDFGVQ